MINRYAGAFTTQRAVILVAIAVLFVICIYPFLVLIERVLFSGTGGSFSLTPFHEIAASSITVTAIINTLLVSTTVSILSCVLALPMAWLLSRTDVPLAKRLRSWLCLPYAVPPYIGAIAWIFLANPTTGLLNKIFGDNIFNIYSFGGLVWVETSFVYTFILLTTLTSLDRMDSSFEEAARLSGSGPVRIFFDITLPLIKPAIFSGAILVFLATAASFGVPALIGSPARMFLMTTQIYTFQKMGSMGGILKAGALSIFLLLFAILSLWLSQYLLRKNQFQTVSGKTSRPSLIELGKWRKVAFFGLLLFWFIVFAMPMIGIATSALSKVQGVFSFSNFTLDNFTRVLFETDETPRAFANSLILGVSAATIACLLGVILSYIQLKTQVPGRNLLDIAASLPYSAPGTVVALSLILAFSTGIFGIGPTLYNTLGMLALAYIVKYLSFAIKTTGDGYRQIHDCLAEAARVSGASWLTTMRSIWIPLMKPSLVAAWFLVFMPVVSELTMTILLTGPGLETIGTTIFQLQEYADASGGGASVLALLVVIMVVAINRLVKTLSRGKYGL